MTDEDQMIAEHDRAVRIVAEAVFGLVDRFAPQGVTPIAVFEGAVRGGALAMALRCHDTPQDIADVLDQMADRIRRMRADELRPVAN